MHAGKGATDAETARELARVEAEPELSTEGWLVGGSFAFGAALLGLSLGVGSTRCELLTRSGLRPHHQASRRVTAPRIRPHAEVWIDGRLFYLEHDRGTLNKQTFNRPRRGGWPGRRRRPQPSGRDRGPLGIRPGRPAGRPPGAQPQRGGARPGRATTCRPAATPPGRGARGRGRVHGGPHAARPTSQRAPPGDSGPAVEGPYARGSDIGDVRRDPVGASQARMSRTTVPYTSVSRSCRPW